MTKCDDDQSNGSTVPVATIVIDTKQPTDLELAINDETDQLSAPTCVQDCGSVSELISDTMEQLCVIDRDDSCAGPSDESNGARTSPNVSPLPQPSKETISGDSLLGRPRIWQKRGRFLIWPVSLDDDRHV